MSYSLNSIKGGYIGCYIGTIIGVIKGYTRSFDYSSHSQGCEDYSSQGLRRWDRGVMSSKGWAYSSYGLASRVLGSGLCSAAAKLQTYLLQAPQVHCVRAFHQKDNSMMLLMLTAMIVILALSRSPSSSRCRQPGNTAPVAGLLCASELRIRAQQLKAMASGLWRSSKGLRVHKLDCSGLRVFVLTTVLQAIMPSLLLPVQD